MWCGWGMGMAHGSLRFINRPAYEDAYPQSPTRLCPSIDLMATPTTAQSFPPFPSSTTVSPPPPNTTGSILGGNAPSVSLVRASRSAHRPFTE